MNVRIAQPEDAAAVQAIYAPIVADTPISFAVEVRAGTHTGGHSNGW